MFVISPVSMNNPRPLPQRDALARSSSASGLIELMDSGVEFVAGDNPHANKLTVHTLAAVAQHEREMISQRTRTLYRRRKRGGETNQGIARTMIDLLFAIPAAIRQMPSLNAAVLFLKLVLASTVFGLPVATVIEHRWRR
jgi:hypothetical protein